MKTVYIFRGAPAAGKGTVVPKFCELLPQPVVLISQAVLRWDFHSIGRKISDIDDTEHELANRNTEMLYEQYLKDGRYNIVLEGSFTWDDERSIQGNVKKLLELAHYYGFNARNVVLKADKKELLKRNVKRPYAVPVDVFEMLYKVYEDIDSSEIVIDSTSQSPKETLEVLKQLI